MKTTIPLVFLLLILSGILLGEDIQNSDNDKSPQENETINWQVISNGGNTSSDGTYTLSGTVSQTAIGLSNDGTHDLHSGYWQSMGIPYLCGDVQADGRWDISDAVFIINLVFVTGAPLPEPLLKGDVDCDGIVSITDAVYLVNLVFVFGSPLPCDPDNDGTPDC